MTRYTGIVKWFDSKKGYGFIQCDKFEKDVFLHASRFERSGLVPDDIADGDKIEFGVEEGKKGHVAVDIKVLEAVG